MVPFASRAIIEPTTLQIASVFVPLDFDSRCAAMVSAVSPDCVIRSVMESGAGMGCQKGEGSGGGDGIAIAVFTRVIHFYRNARQPLDHELTRQARMPAR